MLYNILLDKLPEKSPKGYKLKTSYRQGIKFELLMQDYNIEKQDKIQLALNLFFEEIDWNNIKEQVEDMIWFYQCGEDIKIKSNKSNNKVDKQIYSYEYDALRIYSAFMQQYKIDLQNNKDLHWWKFRAMFECLQDVQIVDIMGYRATNLNEIKDKEERKRIKKLKEIYDLPDMRTEEEKELDFANAFL